MTWWSSVMKGHLKSTQSQCDAVKLLLGHTVYASALKVDDSLLMYLYVT